MSKKHGHYAWPMMSTAKIIRTVDGRIAAAESAIHGRDGHELVLSQLSEARCGLRELRTRESVLNLLNEPDRAREPLTEPLGTGERTPSWRDGLQ